MFTLKIRWSIFERSSGPNPDNPNYDTVEQHIKFLTAQSVDVGMAVGGYVVKPGVKPPAMSTWADDQYINYADVERDEDGDSRRLPSRLIEVVDEKGASTWYLCSFAWLLGPNGGTIERVAP